MYIYGTKSVLVQNVAQKINDCCVAKAFAINMYAIVWCGFCAEIMIKPVFFKDAVSQAIIFNSNKDCEMVIQFFFPKISVHLWF